MRPILTFVLLILLLGLPRPAQALGAVPDCESMAAEAGQLQLNVFEPIIAFRLLRNISALKNACAMLRERCIDGIEANPQQMRSYVEHSIGIVTALVPELGYEVCTEIAKEALQTGRACFASNLPALLRHGQTLTNP